MMQANFRTFNHDETTDIGMATTGAAELKRQWVRNLQGTPDPFVKIL